MVDGIRIGVLISGSGSNLQAIIDACESGEIAGTVVFVGSDRPAVQGIARASARGIPAFVVNYRELISNFRQNPDPGALPDDLRLEDLLAKQDLFDSTTSIDFQERFFRSRILAETALLMKISAFEFDLLVLAGFMRTLTPYFIDRINPSPCDPRIMNIHPAILPAFRGVDGYGDTFRYGCKVGGCTVHFVDYGEDSGPIIGQRAFDILPEDTLEDVRRKGLQLEWALYPECIRLFAQGRLRVVRKSYPADEWKMRSRMVVEILPPK